MFITCATGSKIAGIIILINLGFIPSTPTAFNLIFNIDLGTSKSETKANI